VNDKSVVGDLINFRGLVYAPLNENGVVFLFGKVAEDLNMYIEEIKPGFPDCVARRFTGKGWERLLVEFEYKSSNFLQHGHDPEACDVVICWEHDWEDCPLEVIELRDRIRELENRPIRRPDMGGGEGEEPAIEEWFSMHSVPDFLLSLFGELADYVKELDEECFYKVTKTGVSFYSPERVFMYLNPRKKKLNLRVFTGGESIGKIRQLGYASGGEKWGRLNLSSPDEFEEAKPWIAESLKRIKDAVRKNEATGWYATVSEEGEDDEESE